jgi:hypothetical protein
VLEPAPAHPAPDQECECGLYSLRRPRPQWVARRDLTVPPRVVGAVASWGRLQVHPGGFRAEHACVVAIARHPDAPREAVQELTRIASRYRVELVLLDELEEAAAAYGSRLPDTLHETARTPEPTATPAAHAMPRAPDLDPDDVPQPHAPARPRGLGLIDPLARPHRTASLRARAAFFAFECCVALAFIALALLSYRSASTTSYVQRHGIQAAGHIAAVHRQACAPYRSDCIETTFTVTLTTPVKGVRRFQINYGRNVATPTNRRVEVRVDPRDPHYAELERQPRTSAGIWIGATILAAVIIAATALDGAAVLRKRRHHRRLADTTQ